MIDEDVLGGLSALAQVEYLISEGQLSRARRMCLSDPVLNISYLSGMELKEFHREFVEHLTWQDRTLEMFAATFGKSTLGSKWKVIDEILYNPNVRILLIMKTDPDAHDYCDSIRSEFEFNERLHVLYGGPEYWVGKPWGAKKFNVARRQHRDTHNTLEAYGVKPSVLGHRCDILILDDTVTDENSRTPERRRIYEGWYNKTAQQAPRPMWPVKNGVLQVPSGIYWPSERPYPRIWNYGTRFDIHDHYGKLMKSKTYRCKVRTCWKDDIIDGESAWPEQVSTAALKSEKEDIGPVDFGKRYENRPVDESQLAFKRAYIYGGEVTVNEQEFTFDGITDRNRSFGHFEQDWFRDIGLDPASGKRKRRATWPSMVCAGFPRDPDKSDYAMYVIDLWRSQTDIESVLTAMLYGDTSRNLPGFGRLYRPHLAKIETNAAQNMIPQLDRLRSEADRLNMRLEPHETQGGNKWDPEFGIRGMVEDIKNARISVPYATAADQEKAQPLLYQLEMFPADVYDFCMALWFCWLGGRENVSSPEAFYAEGFADSGWIDVGPSWEEGGDKEGGDGSKDLPLEEEEKMYGYTNDLIFY